MKVKWNKICSAMPSALITGAGGGAILGSAIGHVSMFIGAILGFTFIIYDNYGKE